MIHPIDNPFAKTEGYNCFACGPCHPFGLKLTFFFDNEKNEVFSEISIDPLYAGFPGIIHGGIQTTILDEAAFWGTWARFRRSGFTYDMSIRFLKKCPVDRQLEVRGEVGDLSHRFVGSHVYIWDPETQTILTEGTVRYYLPDIDPRKKSEMA